MIRITLFCFGLLTVLQGFAQKEEALNCEVRHVSNKLQVTGNQVFYALPKNTLRVEIKVERISQFEGPYSKFAGKFLNISEGIIHTDDEFYSIKSVKFHRLSQPDSSKFYSVSCSGFNGFPMLSLNSDGVIIGCNLNKEIEGYATLSCPLLNPVAEADEYSFTNMGVKPFLFEKTETLFKMVATDSTPVKVPYTEKKLVQTSHETNAEEAAAYIRKIRKRRTKLISGIKDDVVDLSGVVVSDMIKEMNRLEQQYIELFVGKSVHNTFTYYFDFEPDEQTDAEQQIIGWFSRSKGFELLKPDIRKTNFKPLIISSNLVGKVPKPQIQVMDQSQKTPTAIKYGLFYRIPGRINVSLRYTDQVLAKQEWEIAQKGQVVPLPVTYLNDQNYAIEFYPETGGIKRIYLNH